MAAWYRKQLLLHERQWMASHLTHKQKEYPTFQAKILFQAWRSGTFLCHWIAIKILSQLKTEAWARRKIFFLKISINCKTNCLILPIIRVINKNHLNFMFRGMNNKKSALVEAWQMYSQIFSWWQTKFSPYKRAQTPALLEHPLGSPVRYGHKFIHHIS